MPNVDVLECFDNPYPQRAYVIEHVSGEFTSLCPKTGHPDFGRIVLRFCPDQLCVELKSLKLYYQSFRNEGAFYEEVTNRIADDLIKLMSPRWLVLESDWTGRGGLHSRLRVTHGSVPAEHR
jgi:7-cyano-7-deazaguanine reductase